MIADLKVNTFVIIFMFVWFGGISLAFVATIIGILKQGTNPLFAIFPLIMIAFGIGLINYGFNTERDK